MKTVVVAFLGPSLPRSHAVHILPEAHFLPPARQADVVSALETYRPDVIALIDGAFGQSQSVWHKEILFALDRGVQVFGAASMGALRAVELGAFGMHGVGEVYRLFASGEIEDDDEVALVHASAADDFRPLSEPLVNLRATFALARDREVLTRADCELLIATARHHYFPERVLPRILAGAIANGLSEVTAQRLSTFCASHYVDVKRRDAQHVLEVIRDLPCAPAERPSFTFERSASFETLYENERAVPQSGVDVPLRAIASYAALHHREFDDVNFAALNRALVMVLASTLRVEPTPADVEAETQRFRRRRGLETDALFGTWLTGQHLSSAAFTVLMGELATCRRMQHWLLARDRGTRHTRWLLDELRLRGQYEPIATAAAEQHAVLKSWDPDPAETAAAEQHAVLESWAADPAETDQAQHHAVLDSRDPDLVVPDQAELAALVTAHRQATDWQLDAPLATWAAEAGFASAQDLELELARAAQLRARLQAAARALAGRADSSGTSPGSR